jgi:hypothetical protein
MSPARSARPEVCNPLFGLPAAKGITALPQEARGLSSALLEDLARDASGRAEAAWKRNKEPMALYWKTASVYARHLAHVLRRRPQPPETPTAAKREGEGASGRTTFRASRAAFSGAKDSWAVVLDLLERGIDPRTIALHHHEVDGEGPLFMGWACTSDYCRKGAASIGAPLYGSWRAVVSGAS